VILLQLIRKVEHMHNLCEGGSNKHFSRGRRRYFIKKGPHRHIPPDFLREKIQLLDIGSTTPSIFRLPGHRSYELLSWLGVRRRPSVNFSHLNLLWNTLNRFEPNLPEMFIGWSSTRFVFLVLIWNSTWLPGSIMCSHWLKF
jgi:hypothetical protein